MGNQYADSFDPARYRAVWSGRVAVFAVAVGVSYMLSGYFGIYSSQKIVYSKLKDEWVDTHTI